jgi:hypothetical protein
MKKYRFQSRKLKLMAVGTRADHMTALYPQKFGPISPTSSGHSFSIVRLQTKSNGVCFVCFTIQVQLKKFDLRTYLVICI